MSAANVSESHLGFLLRTAGKLTLALEFFRSAFRWGAILLGGFLLAVLVDGLLGLQAWGLLTADLVWLGLGFAGLIALVRTILRNWFDPRRTAQALETRLGLRDGRLISAWDLATTPPPAASQVLIERSVELADQFAQNVPLGQTVRLRPLGRSACVLAGVLLLGLAAALGMPRLFAAVLPRLADPWGDHPPFTLVQFDVHVEPEPVLFGKPATIVAKLGGPEEIDRANVVFPGAGDVSRLPMLRRPEGEFVLPIDRAEQSREFYIETLRGRSGRYRLTVLPVPTIEAASVRYAFPRYTNWRETQHPLDSRGIKALNGTSATVTVTSNLPLREGTLVLTPHDKKAAKVTVSLKPLKDTPKTVAATFPLTFSGLYELTLTGVDGTQSRDRVEGPVSVAEDAPPQIEIVDPAPLTLAVENWKVPVLLSARDDVAVESVVLQAGVNGWGPHRQEVALERASRTAATGQYVFDLEMLGASAGDVITFYATARDNRPPAGQSTDTPVYTIQVISKEEYEELARSKYQMDEIVAEFEEFQKKLDELQKDREKLLDEAEKLRAALDQGELDKDGLERLEKLQQQLDGMQEAASKLADDLSKRADQKPLYDFEEQFAEQLRKLSQEMRDQAQAAKSARDAAEALRKQPRDADRQQALKKALEKLEKQSEGLDAESLKKRKETAEDLKTLQQAADLLDQAERLQSLVQQQRDLADRMAELRDARTLTPEQQERARQLAKEQELLEEELNDTTDELEKAAKQCEGSLPKTSGDAKKLVKAIREGKIPGDQQTAAKSARQGQGQEAAERAEAAARKLEALQCEQCNAEGMGEEMSLDSGLKLSKGGARQSLKQLAQARNPMRGSGAKPGQKGEGRGGTQSRVSIAGPHDPSSGNREIRSGRLGEGGKGQGQSPDAEFQAGSPESIDPQSRTGRTTSAGNLRGVPVRYRDQAEAFFKRLAEEK